MKIDLSATFTVYFIIQIENFFSFMFQWLFTVLLPIVLLKSVFYFVIVFHYQGLAILFPIIDDIKYVQSLKEVAIEIPSQSAITLGRIVSHNLYSTCKHYDYL